MNREEWHAEGENLFGRNMLFWKFVCPICSTFFESRDYITSGAPESAIAFNCIGRYLSSCQRAFGDKTIIKGKPCDYIGSGLFKLNPIEVDCDGTIIKVMDFYRKKEGLIK